MSHAGAKTDRKQLKKRPSFMIQILETAIIAELAFKFRGQKVKSADTVLKSEHERKENMKGGRKFLKGLSLLEGLYPQFSGRDEDSSRNLVTVRTRFCITKILFV